MKKARLSEEQIVRILKQHEAGTKTPDLCRKHHITVVISDNAIRGQLVEPKFTKRYCGNR